MGEASAPLSADAPINCLPDEILVDILSRVSLKAAGRTSVLSRRWRYLWTFISRKLCFYRSRRVGSEKFRGWVNRVLELHHAPQLDKFVVHFHCPKADLRADEVDRWVDFAMRKEVKEFKLHLVATCEGRSWYDFPSREKYAFGSLRSLLYYILDPEVFQRHKSIMSYSFTVRPDITYALSYPKACAAESTTFYHENLKLVEMACYIGCPSEEKFLLQLCKMALSLEKVFIDTSGFQFDEEPVPYDKEIVKEAGASTRAEAMERAKNLKVTPPLGAGGDVIMSSTEETVVWQFGTRRKTKNIKGTGTKYGLKHLICTGDRERESNQLS